MPYAIQVVVFNDNVDAYNSLLSYAHNITDHEYVCIKHLQFSFELCHVVDVTRAVLGALDAMCLQFSFELCFELKVYRKDDEDILTILF